MLYIVVPTYNRVEIFYEFIEQLRKQTNQNYRLIVVDHGVKKTNYKDSKAIVINSDVNGWSYAINVGINYVLHNLNAKDTDYILVINDDVLMDEYYLENVSDAILRKPNSLIGSGCYDWNSGKTLHLNMKLNKKKAAFIYKNKGKIKEELREEFYDSDVLKGRGTVLPINILKKIGIYNENKLPHYRADHELAWRAKKNHYDVVVSGRMWLGAVLDSPNSIDGNRTLIDNYRRMFSNMISTENTRDLWNYAFCCFGKVYALYFFCLNYLRYHIIFFWDYRRIKRDVKCK